MFKFEIRAECPVYQCAQCGKKQRAVVNDFRRVGEDKYEVTNWTVPFDLVDIRVGTIDAPHSAYVCKECNSKYSNLVDVFTRLLIEAKICEKAETE
jgi:DNA-directed RNA polymerase subunit RPC12/RpoP